MSDYNYTAFFKAATGSLPYDYQCRLAVGDADSRTAGTDCESRLINIPTGLGKTAVVALAWLWNRVIHPSLNSPREQGRCPRQRGTHFQPPVRRSTQSEGKSTISSSWPRRLVYCLPMRTLVEQTRDNVRAWLKNLGNLEWDRQPHTHAGKVGLHVLMGGEEREENPWDLYPEHDAILIGTQDMLLSRALNRGAGFPRS
jgi:CRISPR-associated endonuclease/helicase Cas3